VDSPVKSEAPEVVGHLFVRAAVSHAAAAEVLNTFDVVIVQHQRGVYGGPDGADLLAVLDRLRVPVIVVAHTVLAMPAPGERLVMQQVINASDIIVTMTETARRRLVGQYGADEVKVLTIPHGAISRDGEPPTPGRRPLILTWGLLGPGKGIEWAIDGLQRIRHLRPLPAYIVAGQTHPRVRQEQGEAYRVQLRQRARAVGVANFVRFESSHLDDSLLTRLICRADIVLLPFDSVDQVTSAVLVEAIVAGKPVVATEFPHAVELLASGAGVVVPHGDAAAIGNALQQILTEPERARRMEAEAARLTPPLLWPAVAERYRSLVTHLLAQKASVV
jgi:glycosyltransferase involved in cell wall biosynthesis